jgi:hypothetical protein
VGNTNGLAILPKYGTDNNGSRIFSFTRSPARTGITLTLQGSDTLDGDWIDLASSVDGAVFLPVDPRMGQENIAAGELREMTFRVNPPVPHFLRLQVTAP